MFRTHAPWWFSIFAFALGMAVERFRASRRRRREDRALVSYVSDRWGR